MSNYIQDFAVRLLPIQKQSPNGWLAFDCPACIHNGEPSRDTKKRMGLMLDPVGSIRYHCFRCGYVCSWHPGQSLNNKIKNLFSWMGASKDNIQQATLECLKIRQNYTQEKIQDEKQIKETKEATLPQHSMSLQQLAMLDTVPNKFLTALNYLQSRGQKLVEWFDDFHWSSEMPEHIIIPLKYHSHIYGWTARLAREPKDKFEPKYYLNNESKFLFNAELLDNPDTKYIILVEGPLDAIALGAVAIMGNQITDKQLKWLNMCDKQIIVFPDKDKGGQLLIDEALKHGWPVSFPDLSGLDIKDGLDLVNYFGRLMAVKMIIDNATDNPLKISMLRKK